jgi:hypothetical protein
MLATHSVELPRAQLKRLVQSALDGPVQVDNGFQEAIHVAALEFVAMLSSEAQDVATREKASVLGPEHVGTALRDLGFGDYAEEVARAVEQAQDTAQSRHRARRASKERVRRSIAQDPAAMKRKQERLLATADAAGKPRG